ncbi:cell division protein ZapB [Rubrivirga sp.]|uniref:cell division protein ZapB n=1 Tax=Rubrivirga sp. TaxID=1885344 RepID=UPI003B523899
MEPTAPSEADPVRPESRPEWRSLSHLRDRVEAAVREIERLRSENAALAKRLLELQEGQASAPSFSFGEGEDPAVLRARVQGFIALVDDLLQAGEQGDGSASTPPSP